MRRLVAEDAAREAGTWSAGAFLIRVGLGPRTRDHAYAHDNSEANADALAHANGYTDADAFAYADADAYANAYANANANADANADADAYAYAYADANNRADANADANAYTFEFTSSFTGGEHMRNGLYLWAQPSGNVVVLRVGWIRRVSGDEYEALNMVTPKRTGYSAMFADAAIDGPPESWSFTRPLPRPSPLNRFHILGPVSLDPAQWAKVSPKPADWED